MSRLNLSDENRPLETTVDDSGRDSATALLASPGSTDTMYVRPRQAIPVVFVPGIMGSPLIATQRRELFNDQGQWAWFPDGKAWMALGYGSLTYMQRRTLLNPAQTRPVRAVEDADRETVQDNLENSLIGVDEALRRGWGSVMISSYGGILVHLENQLRYVFHRGSLYPGIQSVRPSSPGNWGELSGYVRLTDDQLRRAAGWAFPVYAVGYNWLESNGAAADYLKERVDIIKADCTQRLNMQCDKVILVTHSMGGLVARMYAKRHPNDVLGIVHGVQPAIGAATAYARVRTGWESNPSITRPFASVAAAIGAWALGPTGHEVAAVFANGPGPLELLPNQLYGAGWFRVTSRADGSEVFSLPSAVSTQGGSDPYEQIYRVSDRWWRLVHPGILTRPADSANQAALMAQWLDYSSKLDLAKGFHSALGSYYHPETYTHFGNDRGRVAWHRVGWELEPLMDISTGLRARAMPSAATARDILRLTRDHMTGTCTLNNPATAGLVAYERNGRGVTSNYGGDMFRAWISEQDNHGDSTVPAHSAVAPRAHSRFFVAMQGFEHQDSYNNNAVRSVTLYSVLRLAAGATPLQ